MQDADRDIELIDMPDAKAREFSRRRNLPYVEVRHMNSKACSTVTLSHTGRDLGSKITTYKRGKVVTTHYYLPELPTDL
jgi:hypothetical protein